MRALWLIVLLLAWMMVPVAAQQAETTGTPAVSDRVHSSPVNTATAPNEAPGPNADSAGERVFNLLPAVVVGVMIMVILVVIAQRHLFRPRSRRAT